MTYSIKIQAGIKKTKSLLEIAEIKPLKNHVTLRQDQKFRNYRKPRGERHCKGETEKQVTRWN